MDGYKNSYEQVDYLKTKFSTYNHYIIKFGGHIGKWWKKNHIIVNFFTNIKMLEGFIFFASVVSDLSKIDTLSGTPSIHE